MIPRVAHIAPIFEAVPPRGYGGVERIVDELSEVQVQLRCCRVVVYASNDSTVSAPLRSIVPSCGSVGRYLRPDQSQAVEKTHYLFACRDARDADVLHAHGTWMLPYADRSPRPIVMSVYTDTSDPVVRDQLRSIPPNVHLVANSKSTLQKFPAAPWHDVVLEGVMPSRYPYAERKCDYLLFVGKLTPSKGAHIAIQVALATGQHLKLIGPSTVQGVPEEVVRAQNEYAQTKIFPFVDGRQIEYLGELGAERLPLLSKARCLLFPISWEEPFGRILAEAMACGTPVVAFRRGAVPEVVSDGRSGLIVDSIDDMIQAARSVHRILPTDCRDHVLRHLNISRVAQRYAEIYGEVLK